MAVKFSQFSIGTASATAYVVGYDGSSNVRIPATALTPSGTPGVLPKYASPSGLANSLISDNGSYVTVGGFLIATNDATINGLVAGRGNGALADNVAFGVSALSSNISGSASVSIGGYSLSSNSTGNSNVAVGAYAMQLSGQANNNVAIGQSALNGLTGISGNTDTVAIGYQAMRTKTGALGAANVAVGTLALADGGGTGGSNNVAIGTQALRNLTSGIRNVAVGYQAQRFNLTATGNVGVGWQSLYNATGNTNVAIGFLSGYLITTGTNNVVIGGNSGSSIATLSNFMIFSDGAGNERFRIPSTGNVLINTTTDAGYRLDVSGTTRISGTELRLDNGTTGTLNIYSATPTINFFSGGGYSIGRTSTTLEMISGGSIIKSIGANQAYQIDATNGHLFKSAIAGSASLARLTTGGNFIVGSTTDNGQRVQIVGSLRIDGQRSATAGGNSGQHLIVNCDGTNYKIVLLNV